MADVKALRYSYLLLTRGDAQTTTPCVSVIRTYNIQFNIPDNSSESINVLDQTLYGTQR